MSDSVKSIEKACVESHYAALRVLVLGGDAATFMPAMHDIRCGVIWSRHFIPMQDSLPGAFYLSFNTGDQRFRAKGKKIQRSFAGDKKMWSMPVPASSRRRRHWDARWWVRRRGRSGGGFNGLSNLHHKRQHLSIWRWQNLQSVSREPAMNTVHVRGKTSKPSYPMDSQSFIKLGNE